MSVHYSRTGDIAVLAADNPPVNALGHSVRAGLDRGLDQVRADGAKVVLIHGEGRTWFAGADIREFGKPPRDPLLPDLCNRIEAMEVPVIAAMHGTVLGGGLEVALSCHYRLAVPDTKLGLPEVTLGIIPGAGGTQRLPRLTGYAEAIAMITSGRPIDAAKGEALGILDRVEAGELRALGLAYAQDLLDKGAAPRQTRALPAPEPVDFAAARARVAAKARGQLSLAVAVDAIAASQTDGFDAGLAEERRLFSQLVANDQSACLRHAFFVERQTQKLPELDGTTPRPVDVIAVIGGGTMGAGIATACLLAGLTVAVIEMSDGAAEAARARITGNLSGALKRGKITQAQFDAMSGPSLTCGAQDEALSDADLIIEAVFEDMDVKQQVFSRIDRAAKPGAILATNTSYLNVDAIAQGTGRPADVIGLHFFSPAHVMRLLEVVVGAATAPEVVATAFALAKRLGKVAVRSGVCDGFIGNRVLQAYRTASDHMVLDGASPFEIDRALEGFGFAMGPFAVADLAGLDIGWANRKRLARHRDPRARVSVYADRLCEAGHLGQKTGRGYYVYGETRSENPDVLELISAERAERGLTPRAFTDAEIVERYMAAMVNEAARVVDEGIARRPLDVDVVLLHGYGFPRHHGGPMKWADLRGLSDILEMIRGYAREDAFFWQPAPLLERLVTEGTCFEDLNKGAQ